MWIAAYALRRPYRIAVFAVPTLLSAAGKAMPPDATTLPSTR